MSGTLAPRRGRDALVALLALGVGGGALAFLLRGVGLDELAAAFLRQPARDVAAALALTAASFAGLASYDAVALRIVAGHRVRLRLGLLAGATGSAVANTLGLHAVTGTAVRARLYLAAGLSGAEIARIASLSWLALLVGNATMLAAAELLQAALERRADVHLALGLALSAALGGYVAWLARGRREIVIRRWRFPLPSASVALVQMAVGAIESGTAIGALYVLLPADLRPSFSLFAAGCIAAVTLGVAAHTPGGIGVFEAAITTLLAGRGRADLLAALLLYRLLYNLLPFVLSVLVLGVFRVGARERARGVGAGQ